jgi:hypothetical protein
MICDDGGFMARRSHIPGPRSGTIQGCPASPSTWAHRLWIRPVDQGRQVLGCGVARVVAAAGKTSRLGHRMLGPVSEETLVTRL